MKNKLCIDLCSGLKGFSSAFEVNSWEVVTVDIEPKFNPSICIDVRKLTINDLEKVTKYSLNKYDLVIVLAAPPCERFSLAPVAWPLPGIGQALEIVGSILELIIKIKPKYWCLENPSTGHLRWFIGKHCQRINQNVFGYKTVKPTGLWGNINIPFGLIHTAPKKNKIRWENINSKRPDLRSKIPYGLSDVIRQTVENNKIPDIKSD